MKVQWPHGLIVGSMGNRVAQLVEAVRVENALDTDAQDFLPRVEAKPNPSHRHMGGRTRNVHSLEIE